MTRNEWLELPWYKRWFTQEPLPDKPLSSKLIVHLKNDIAKPVYVNVEPYWWQPLGRGIKDGAWFSDPAGKARDIVKRGVWLGMTLIPPSQIIKVEIFN